VLNDVLPFIWPFKTLASDRFVPPREREREERERRETERERERCTELYWLKAAACDPNFEKQMIPSSHIGNQLLGSQFFSFGAGRLTPAPTNLPRDASARRQKKHVEPNEPFADFLASVRTEPRRRPRVPSGNLFRK